jgi:hypothetical protein
MTVFSPSDDSLLADDDSFVLMRTFAAPNSIHLSVCPLISNSGAVLGPYWLENSHRMVGLTVDLVRGTPPRRTLLLTLAKVSRVALTEIIHEWTFPHAISDGAD